MHQTNLNRIGSVAFGMLAGVLILGLLVTASAQENMGRGRIGGQVTDEADAPVAGVKVVAQSAQSAARLESVTDKKGRYSIIGLGTGIWRITAEKEGYAPAVIDKEIFQLKTNPPIDFVLKKADAAQAVGGAPLLDEGNAALEKGSYDEAIALYRQFQAASPEVYGVRANIALAFQRKGDLDAAEAEYKGVLEDVLRVQGEYAKDKNVSVRAFSGLGEVAFKRGDLETGRKYFTEALNVSPEDENAAYNVGEILFSNQNIDEAIHFFEMAAEIKKDWSKPRLRLGYVYLNKGDLDKAIENFNAFLALDPDSPEAEKVKGMIAAIEKMK